MLSIALSRPARATYRATCAGLGKPARHHGQGHARTAASVFLLRLGFCELALAAESLAGLTVQALGVGLQKHLASYRRIDVRDLFEVSQGGHAPSGGIVLNWLRAVGPGCTPRGGGRVIF